MQKSKLCSEEVTQSYAAAVFEQIGEAGDGMQEAADGAGKLRKEPKN